MTFLRSTLFLLFIALWSVLVTPLVILTALLFSGTLGFRLGRFWRRGIQWGVCHMLQIQAEVKGLENIPDEPCLILSKHQSAWETLFLQDYVPKGAYCVFVLKKELLRLPFVGWGFAALKMISIDRRAGRGALDDIVRQGKERLEQGFYVIIFPEGTRVAPGKTARYKAGGAYLATQVGCKVVPVAHNAGECWPRQAFLKKSGKVTVHIGKAIDAEKLSEKELNEQVAAWIEQEMRVISPERYNN